MNVIADMIRAGVDPEIIQRVHDEIVEAARSAAPTRTSRQDRNARYYQNRKARLKASEQDDNKTTKTVSDAKSQDIEVSREENNTTRAPALIPVGISNEIPPSELEKNKQKNPSSKAFDDEFEGTFWPAWKAKTAHCVDRKGAKQAYATQRRAGQSQDAILSGLDRYVAAKPDWQSWKSPMRWLRDQRFLDEAAPAQVARGSPPPPSEPVETIRLLDGSEWPKDIVMKVLDSWAAGNGWSSMLGRPPGSPKCIIPEELLGKRGDAA